MRAPDTESILTLSRREGDAVELASHNARCSTYDDKNMNKPKATGYLHISGYNTIDEDLPCLVGEHVAQIRANNRT
jgi:hypothetical protein